MQNSQRWLVWILAGKVFIQSTCSRSLFPSYIHYTGGRNGIQDLNLFHSRIQTKTVFASFFSRERFHICVWMIDHQRISHGLWIWTPGARLHFWSSAQRRVPIRCTLTLHIKRETFDQNVSFQWRSQGTICEHTFDYIVFISRSPATECFDSCCFTSADSSSLVARRMSRLSGKQMSTCDKHLGTYKLPLRGRLSSFCEREEKRYKYKGNRSWVWVHLHNHWGKKDTLFCRWRSVFPVCKGGN